MGEDGGGGEGVGKLAAGNVAEEKFVAHAVDNERGQGNGVRRGVFYPAGRSPALQSRG